MPPVKSQEVKSKMPWLDEAKRLLGVEEDTSDDSNQDIIDWAQEFGGWVASYYESDDIPWCGLFVGHCFLTAKSNIGFKNILGALNWKSFGIKLSEPCYGCLLVFKRPGGGHVGFYVSEDDDYYHVLGGNQSDEVNVTKVAKERLVAIRWPTEYRSSIKPGRIVKDFDGKVSTNEA